MKINPIVLLISLVFSALVSYGFWAANSNDKFGLLISIVAGAMFFVFLSSLIAVQSKETNGSIGNLRAISIVMLIVSLITNIVFSFFNFQNPAAYIIISGIELLLFVIISYGVFRALK